MTDIQAYANFVDQLRKEIGYVKEIVIEVLGRAKVSNSYYEMIRAQQAEILEINTTFQTVMLELREIIAL